LIIDDKEHTERVLRDRNNELKTSTASINRRKGALVFDSEFTSGRKQTFTGNNQPGMRSFRGSVFVQHLNLKDIS
jgi:hypothetical protein